jgi:arylsulfatase A-like enzyme
LLHDDDVIEQQPDQSLLTERYVQEAIDFIRADSPKPFFLYLAHMYVHLPIYVKQEFLDNSENGSYGAAVESIDWATSVIMNELHSLGLDENTIVIFTSDNGSLGNVHPPFGDRKELIGGSNLPLRGAKGTTWEGGQRVPAIVRWKGKIEAGRVCDELLTAMDFYPTLANLCGAKVPQDRIIDGIDAQAVWFDRQAKSQHEHFVYYRANGLEAIRDRQYKLHFGRGNQDVFELYDIAHDVAETVNVYDQYPEVVASLTKAANHYRQTLGDDRTGSVGTQVRPIGRVDNPRPLTEYDSRNPYVIAEYDLPDRG